VVDGDSIGKPVREALVILAVGRYDSDRTRLVQTQTERRAVKTMTTPVGHSAAGAVSVCPEAPANERRVERAPRCGADPGVLFDLSRDQRWQPVLIRDLA